MITFSDDQETASQAIDDWYRAGKQRCFTLMGSAGTGKTTLTAWKMIEWADKHTFIYMAPTHRAVAVMKEKVQSAGLDDRCFTYAKGTNRILAKDDIRRYLINKGGPNKLMESAAIAIIDEASWIDDKTWNILNEEAERYNVRLLFVGDPYQLPPVAARATWPVFHEVEGIELVEVVRQAAGSIIIKNAQLLRHHIASGTKTVRRIYVGTTPDGQGVYRIPRADTVESICEAATTHGKSNIRVLAWRRKRVLSLSNQIRHRLYGVSEGEPWVPGERVVNMGQVKGESGDNYLYSHQESTVIRVDGPHIDRKYGDLEYIRVAVRPDGRTDIFYIKEALDPDALGALLSQMADEAKEAEPGSRERGRLWRRFWTVREDFAELSTAYVSTVHSSQGGTLDSVWLDVEDIEASQYKSGAEFANRMLYVGLTRAANSVFLTEG